MWRQQPQPPSGLIALARDHPVLAAAGGAVLIAFSGIWVRLADVEPATAAVFRCVYALPVLAPLALLERRRMGPRSRRSRAMALLAGALFAADLVFWHTAIDFVGAGLATVLANLQVVAVALAAWALLGERPQRRTLAAVPIVLAGVVAISGVAGGEAYGEDPLLGVVFGLLTAAAYSGFLLTLRAGNADLRRPAGPLCDATAAAAVTAALAGAVVGVDLVPAWPAHGWLAALALGSQVAGWLCISVSLPRVPAAVTSIVLMIQPSGAVLLGMALLAERPSPVQLAGVVVVLAGVLLATARRRDPPGVADAPALPASGDTAGIGS